MTCDLLEGKILLGNNIDHMKLMKDGLIDLIVTSPPYDDERTYDGYVFDFEKTANAAYRILKDRGVMIWNVGDKVKSVKNKNGYVVNNTDSLTSFRQAIYFQEIGFSIRVMLFRKQNYMPVSLDSPHYAKEFEYVFVCTKGGIPMTSNLLKIDTQNSGQSGTKTRYRKDGGKDKFTSEVKPKKVKGNIFTYVVGNANDDDKTNHEAVFPEKFARDMIHSYSNKGELVYDMFGGSGTTCKMAELMGRRWVMSEWSENNCNESKLRLEHYANRPIEIMR